MEHIFRVIAAPRGVAINRGQSRAPTEHLTYNLHLGNVEAREVNLGKRGASYEHLVHGRHLRRVEVGKI